MDGQPPMEGPPHKKGGLPIGQLINLSGLVSGGATLGLFFAAGANSFSAVESGLNLSASILALAFGAVGVLDLSSKPDRKNRPEGSLPPPPSNSTEPAPVLLNMMHSLQLEESPIL